jgi:hypothetical protein
VPHTIRLRGPWQVQPAGLAAGTAAVPVDWSDLFGAAFRGPARFTRHFQRPTGLDRESRVWLVVEHADIVQRVALNGAELFLVGQASSLPDTTPNIAGQATRLPHEGRLDITSILAPRNELTVDVALPPDRSPPGSLLANVRLEIDA